MKGLPYSLKPALQKGLVAGQHQHQFSALVSVSSTGAAIGFGSLALFMLPQGRITVLDCAASIGFVAQDGNLISTWSGDWSLGTVATVDNDLDDTDEADLIPSTAIGPADAGAIAGEKQFMGGSPPIVIDNTAGDTAANLNVLADAASITDDETAVIRVAGYVHLLMGYV